MTALPGPELALGEALLTDSTHELQRLQLRRVGASTANITSHQPRDLNRQRLLANRADDLKSAATV